MFGIIRGGKYSEVDAKKVMVQILSVVAYCHLQGVVHRDLKPEVNRSVTVLFWFLDCSLILNESFSVFFFHLQNFLFTTKDESSPLKAIDFGLSDYVRPGKRF